jgi:hypothetical protein
MNFLKRLTCIIFGHRPELHTVKNIEWSYGKTRADTRCVWCAAYYQHVESVGILTNSLIIDLRNKVLLSERDAEQEKKCDIDPPTIKVGPKRKGG